MAGNTGIAGQKVQEDDEQSWLDGIARVERHLGGASVEVVINLLGSAWSSCQNSCTETTPPGYARPPGGNTVKAPQNQKAGSRAER
ncbi:MAG: hypothetical protein H6559_37960 [Lewinellaceae bacterium]|nr:hypothetical protein [Lewinellaceae bacterium]